MKLLKSTTKISASRSNPRTKEQLILQGNYYDGTGWYDLGGTYNGYSAWADDSDAVKALRQKYRECRDDNSGGSFRLISRRVPNPNYVEPNPEMVANISVNELKDKYYANNPGGHFFDRDTLKFFGERLSEMRVSRELVSVEDSSGNVHICYELVSKQRNAPGGTRTAYHYFDKDTFEQIIT